VDQHERTVCLVGMRERGVLGCCSTVLYFLLFQDHEPSRPEKFNKSNFLYNFCFFHCNYTRV